MMMILILQKKFNMKYFKVTEILKLLKPLIDIYKKIKNNDDNNIPYFLTKDMFEPFDLSELEDLVKRYGENVCITSEFDMDVAYTNGIYFKVFKGDL